MNDYCELPPHKPEKPHPPLTTEAPYPSAAEKDFKHSRRTFLFQLAVGMNLAVAAVLAVPLLGYVITPIFRKNGSYNAWVAIAKLDEMPVGATRLLQFTNPVTTPTDGETAKIPVWARRTTRTTYEVFAINCAHLGCPVHWFEQSQLFLCPCHGGAYYSTGEVAAGPPPRGLYKYKVRVDGETVSIHAGEIPTLRDVACSGPKGRDLIQIGPATPSANSPIGDNLLPSGGNGQEG